MIHTDILFTGYYGMKNTGDDAFVEVASWGAKKYWQKENCKFLGRQNYLPKTIIPSKGYPFTIPKTYSLQKNILVRNTQYLISAGGSTIHSELQSNNVKKIAVDLKKQSNLHVGAIGVSIGPFRTINDEKAVKRYLKEIDFIAVRDQTSFDFANSLDLPYKPINAFDLAALLPEIYQPSQKSVNTSELKVVGISVCPVESVHSGGDLKNESRRNSQIVEMIKSLDHKANILFRFFIINGNSRNGDLALTKKIIQDSLPKNYEVIDYQNETRVMWEYIASCDFVLATRLHAAIFACFAEVPFMLVEYHRKCTDFLLNVGYRSDYMIGDAEFESTHSADRALEWINDNKNYSTPTYLKEMTQKAFLNFTEIKL